MPTCQVGDQKIPHLPQHLSATIVAGSNYGMQILGSHTRKQLSEAHKKLSFGIVGQNFTIRNMSVIGFTRTVLACLIFLSTVPLSLLYNAAVTATIEARDFRLLVVDSDFFNFSDHRRDNWMPDHNVTLTLSVDPDFFNSSSNNPRQWMAEHNMSVTWRDDWDPIPEWRSEINQTGIISSFEDIWKK